MDKGYNRRPRRGNPKVQNIDVFYFPLYIADHICTTTDEMLEVLIAAYALLSLLNVAALLLMYKTKWDLPNQYRLTMNLAVTEMCCCCYMAIRFSILLAENWREDWSKVDTFVSGLFYAEHRFNLLHIIADRFMEIYTNVKYPLYMSTKKLTRIIGSLWLLAFSFALTCLILRLTGQPNTSLRITVFTISGLDVLIFLFAVGTYTYFYLKVRRIKISARRNDGSPQQELSLVWKKFKLPCYIALTYVLFNLTSTLTIAKAYYQKHQKRNLDEYSRLMYIAVILDLVGFLSDTLIYLFLNKNVRKQLLSTFRLHTPQT